MDLPEAGTLIAGLQATKKVAEPFLAAILGDSSKELGLLLKEKISERRYSNLLKIAAKAKQQLREAGLSSKEVPLSIVHPLLEHCSLEENDELQALWATMLANSATESGAEVLRSFIEVVKQLSKHEATFLNRLLPIATSSLALHNKVVSKVWIGGESEILNLFDHEQRRNGGAFQYDAVRYQFMLMIDNLIRLGLVGRVESDVDMYEDKFFITNYCLGCFRPAYKSRSNSAAHSADFVQTTFFLSG